MLYRVHPNGASEWVDNLGSEDLELADRHEGADFDRLEWKPADQAFDTDRIRLALRYGRPSRVGIFVAATDLVPAYNLERLRESHAEVIAHRPKYRNELAKLEQAVPGRLAAEDASEAAVDASTARTLERFEAELAAALAVEPRADLVEHWLRVGGIAPDPL